MTARLTGLIAATHTPFRSDGTLNLTRIRPLVEHLIAQGVSGLYVNGSTGEGPSLTTAERKQTAEAFVAAVQGRLPVVVQVGHNCLDDALDLARHAQQIKADALSAVAPSYFKPASIESLVECMAKVAGGAPELPFYYYHIPAMAGVQFDMPTFLSRAADRIPTFTGMKYTAPTIWEYQACVAADGGRYDCLYGLDEMLLPALAVGAKGAVGSTYNFAAPIYRRVIAAQQSGDLSEARRFQEQAIEMVRILFRHSGFAAMKAMMKLIGHDCGPVRLPVSSLGDEELRALEKDLRMVGFFDWIARGS